MIGRGRGGFLVIDVMYLTMLELFSDMFLFLFI